ncbi:hypothetical protein F4780DRAFT_276363 [Xylariomycetidae sp. FL0641]|nr:hypothetical protein F4780DRAFT_276363 [Xylariomycetidae sp. FL0641]
MPPNDQENHQRYRFSNYKDFSAHFWKLMEPGGEGSPIKLEDTPAPDSPAGSPKRELSQPLTLNQAHVRQTPSSAGRAHPNKEERQPGATNHGASDMDRQGEPSTDAKIKLLEICITQAPRHWYTSTNDTDNHPDMVFWNTALEEMDQVHRSQFPTWESARELVMRMSKSRGRTNNTDMSLIGRLVHTWNCLPGIGQWGARQDAVHLRPKIELLFELHNVNAATPIVTDPLASAELLRCFIMQEEAWMESSDEDLRPDPEFWDRVRVSYNTISDSRTLPDWLRARQTVMILCSSPFERSLQAWEKDTGIAFPALLTALEECGRIIDRRKVERSRTLMETRFWPEIRDGINKALQKAVSHGVIVDGLRAPKNLDDYQELIGTLEQMCEDSGKKVQPAKKRKRAPSTSTSGSEEEHESEKKPTKQATEVSTSEKIKKGKKCKLTPSNSSRSRNEEEQESAKKSTNQATEVGTSEKTENGKKGNVKAMKTGSQKMAKNWNKKEPTKGKEEKKTKNKHRNKK